MGRGASGHAAIMGLQTVKILGFYTPFKKDFATLVFK
jgi:hypothetical protein